MITGSSAITNIQAAPVKTPSIRATLYASGFVGGNVIMNGARNADYAGMETTVFRDNYLIGTNSNPFSTSIAQSNESIYTYNAGGSLLSRAGLTFPNTGSGAILGGDFVEIGSTLAYYFTVINGLSNLSLVSRIASSNGVVWGGGTVLYSTPFVGGNLRDVFMEGVSGGYVTGGIGPSFAFYDRIYRFDLGGSLTNILSTPANPPSLYSITGYSLEKESILIYEAQQWGTIGFGAGGSPIGWEYINLLRAGSKNVFEQREIIKTGVSWDSYRLIKGGYGSSYMYFGIQAFQDVYQGNIRDVSSILAICKVDREGHISQRSVVVGASYIAGIFVGGASNANKETLSILYNNGNSQFVRMPLYDEYGVTTDISPEIVSYSNNNNNNISISLGNLK